MKSVITACILILGAAMVRGGEIILPYSAFGPQAAAHELIGMEWWQWESHGDDKDRDYPIKVVVFWDQTLEEISKVHPVDKMKLQDFRYVECSKAVLHMERIIKEFKKAKLDASDIESALSHLKKQKAEQDADNATE